MVSRSGRFFSVLHQGQMNFNYIHDFRSLPHRHHFLFAGVLFAADNDEVAVQSLLVDDRLSLWPVCRSGRNSCSNRSKLIYTFFYRINFTISWKGFSMDLDQLSADWKIREVVIRFLVQRFTLVNAIHWIGKCFERLQAACKVEGILNFNLNLKLNFINGGDW